MDESKAIAAFSALAQPTRLKAIKLLVVAGAAGVPAGNLAAALDVPHNTMSSHLSILSNAGLVNATRAGRTVNYRADFSSLQLLLRFLMENCCEGERSMASGSSCLSAAACVDA